MSTTHHNHTQMNSQYCPVCGEKLAGITNLVDALETYAANKDDLEKILLQRPLMKKITDQTPGNYDKLTSSLEHVDAPVNMICDFTDGMPEGVIIIRDAGTDYHTAQNYTTEEFIDHVKDRYREKP